MQLSIFEAIKAASEPALESDEGQFKCIDRLRAAIRTCLKKTHLSVHQLAGQMSHLVGATITAEQIYSWTRESDELNGRCVRHIPAEYIPALCHVTGCNDPIIVMGRMVGLFTLPGPEALRAEIQRLDEEMKKIQAEKRKRSLFLKEMEG